MKMVLERGLQTYAPALAAVAASLLVAGHAVAAPDLAGPELKPVTAGGAQLAIDAAIGMAGRRLLPLTGAASATLVQQGQSNRIDLVQGDRANVLNATQQGALNAVSASQQGMANVLDVSQQGNGNAVNASQAGGTHALVIQLGDAHRADIYQTSTSPNIVVRQSGAGTVVQTTQY